MLVQHGHGSVKYKGKIRFVHNNEIKERFSYGRNVLKQPKIIYKQYLVSHLEDDKEVICFDKEYEEIRFNISNGDNNYFNIFDKVKSYC